MKHYLYGLTIHSIQSYIFQTNKLKEIAGASELVEQICTTLFAETLKTTTENLKKDDKAIRNAAGNIRYAFNDEAACKEVVLKFPKKILDFAPGIHISQAVVETEEDPNESHFKILEERLTAQRNNLFRPVDLGYMAINRSRRTGLPSCEGKDKDGNPLDRPTFLKLEQIKKSSRVSELFFGSYFDKKRITADVEKIVSSKDTNYNWLAVIHADGNNMGKALQDLGSANAQTLKAFSKAVDTSTKTAAQKAFLSAMQNEELNETETIPFRPIIVGGDDLTIICRADLALKFTAAYLTEFEIQTKTNFNKPEFTKLTDGLTACAGIAFVKSSYPFHYAIGLAERLCAHAKKDAKSKVEANGLVPSCLMFHKVQDSFIEDFSEIIDRELTAKKSNIRFDFGPYYTIEQEGNPTINDLLTKVSFLRGKDGNAIKSSLRQWLTDLHDNKGMAKQRMKRLISVGNDTILNNLGIKKTQGIIGEKSPVYDWLTILSINLNEE